MELSRMVFKPLTFGETLEILSYLTMKEVYRGYGCLCRTGWHTFRREVDARKSSLFLRSGCKFVSRGAWARALMMARRGGGGGRGRGSEEVGDKVLLVSYPRCGNSFLRSLIESATGQITGSDSLPNRTLSASLLRCGYQGEGIVDSSVCVIKSHFPERLGYLSFRAKRVLLLVRNPFDAIESYFHMGFTNTHDRMLAPEAFALPCLQEIWDKFVPHEATIWNAFYAYWLAIASSVPTMIVRYEDLLQDEAGTMARVLAFMRQGATPVPETSEYQSKAAASQLPGYAPKKSTRQVGKSLLVMSQQQRRAVVEGASVHMGNFGYSLQNQQGEAAGGAAVEVEEAERLLVSPMSQAATFPACSTEAVNDKGLLINSRTNLRSEDDFFGRRMTEMRRSLTDLDTKPFAKA